MKPIGPITPEFSFDIFCSLLLKKDLFSKKKTDWLQSEIFFEGNSSRLAQN